MSDFAKPPARDWTVWRIDDNGNIFVVQRGLARLEAEQLVAEFTARGHKQMYWAEQEAAETGSPGKGGE